MNNYNLQSAVAEAMKRNSGGVPQTRPLTVSAPQQQQQNPYQTGMPQMPQAFPTTGPANPYAIGPNAMTWQNYASMMNRDYTNAGLISQQPTPAPTPEADLSWLDEQMYVNPNYRGIKRGAFGTGLGGIGGGFQSFGTMGGQKQRFDQEWMPGGGGLFGIGTNSRVGYGGMTFGQYLKKEMPWVDPASLSEDQVLALQKKMQSDYLASQRSQAQERWNWNDAWSGQGGGE